MSKLRKPVVGDTWAYRGTRHKGSRITITAVYPHGVCYQHERRATTKPRLFHKRFEFVCSKEEGERRLAEGMARAEARRAAENTPPRKFDVRDPKQLADGLEWATRIPKAFLGFKEPK